MELFAIASKCDVNELKTIAEEKILRNIEPTNALEVFNLAHLYDSQTLKNEVFNEIKEMFPEVPLNKSLMEQPESLKKLIELKRSMEEVLQEFTNNSSN
jgi:hypothetical protein